MQCLGRSWAIIFAFPPVVYPFSRWAGYFFVAIATGEVNYYNYIVRLRSIPSLTETIGLRQFRPLAREDIHKIASNLSRSWSEQKTIVRRHATIRWFELLIQRFADNHPGANGKV